MNENNCANEESMNAMNGHNDDNELNADTDIDINKRAIQTERKDQMWGNLFVLLYARTIRTELSKSYR